MALDLTLIIIPILGSIIASFVILMFTRHLTKADKSASDSTVATINLTNVQGDLEDFKKHVDKKFDEILEKIDCHEKERRRENREMWEKMADFAGDMKVIKNRLDRLERNGRTV